MNDVTRVLAAIEQGDPRAAEQLLPLVYDELRRLASRKLDDERPGQTLQATALVHEAFLRLVGNDGRQDWDGRGHFFAAAAEAMRRILVDAARRKRRERHGGGRARLDLDEASPVAPPPRDDLIALDEALTRLAAEYPDAARLIELRHFTGLTVPEAARALGIAPRTADRLWAFGRAWLHRELTGSPADPRSSE
jgi:RNA polymerase sigma factor (TIGR02999 family)